MGLAIEEFSSYHESIVSALNTIRAHEVLSKEKKILLKLNLTNSTPHPVTTPMECCEAIIQYIRKCSTAEIIIAEGCGDAVLETDQIFTELGYDGLVEKYDGFCSPQVLLR